MKLCVVIPTYNEANNIRHLVERILSQNLDMHIIIVDDNSPDRTGEIAEQLRIRFKPRVHVIHRPGKLGLGSAYITGFNYALKNLKPEYILTMDADFSHDPDRIPDFVRKMEEGYDVVVGSRYIHGGGVEWQFYRKILSRGANLFAKTVLGFSVHDLTGGFRCYRREALEKINLSEINSDGFSFMEEFLYLCKKANCRITEIPIFFRERQKGKSKLSKVEMVKFFLTVLRLRIF